VVKQEGSDGFVNAKATGADALFLQTTSQLALNVSFKSSMML